MLAKDQHDLAAEPALHRVVEVYRRTVDHLRLLSIRDSGGREHVLRTTDDHPFFIVGEGWANAANLVAGDKLLEPDGALSELVASVREAHPAGVRVYNFQVETAGTYFARAQGAGGRPVWVHNADYDPIPTFHEHLWRPIPVGNINASNFSEFRRQTKGWFTAANSFRRPPRTAEEASQGWYWYQQAKGTPDELVLGNFSAVRKFLNANPTGYHRLNANPWQLQVNDAWVIGGVERNAVYRVVTNIHAQSYRKTPLRDGRIVESVFNRELRMLEARGYGFVRDTAGWTGTGWMRRI